MFQYKNHRLHLPRVSFQIPDGFYLNTEPSEISDNLLSLWDPQKTFALEVRLDDNSQGAHQEMQSILEDLSPEILLPPAPIQLDTFSGYHATYRTKREQYYELWLDLEPGSSLSVVLYTKHTLHGIDTKAVADSLDIRAEGNILSVDFSHSPS